MVRPNFVHSGHDHQLGSIPLMSIGLFISISALVALCAKHAKRVSTTHSSKSLNETKFAPKSPLRSPRLLSNKAIPFVIQHPKVEAEAEAERFVPKSPLRSPRQLMTAISDKAIIPFISNQRKTEAEIGGGKLTEEGFGEGGLWQKEILMGEKCQPLEFSGVIYYDCYGNKISELPPRSPRGASPLSPLAVTQRSPRGSPLSPFAFPLTRDGN